MKKYFLVAIALLVPSISFAGTEGSTVANPVFDDGANTWRLINIAPSTGPAVLISSAAIDAVFQSSITVKMGIGAWRTREIVNTSTCCSLALFPASTFTSFSSTGGVVLSSDTTGNGYGDSWVVSHQGEVWGIWRSTSADGIGNGGLGGAGAGGYESYFQPSKRR